MLIHALPILGQDGLASARWFDRARSWDHAVAHGHKCYDTHGQIPNDDMICLIHTLLNDTAATEKEQRDK